MPDSRNAGWTYVMLALMVVAVAGGISFMAWRGTSEGTMMTFLTLCTMAIGFVIQTARADKQSQTIDEVKIGIAAKDMKIDKLAGTVDAASVDIKSAAMAARVGVKQNVELAAQGDAIKDLMNGKTEAEKDAIRQAAYAQGLADGLAKIGSPPVPPIAIEAVPSRNEA